MRKPLLACIMLYISVFCNGQTWQPVDIGTDGKVGSFCQYNNLLYVGGEFTSAGGIPVTYIASWDGNNWDSVGSGTNNEIEAFTTFNNKLYAGGGFDTAGGKPISEVAEWDGSTWLPLGNGLSGGNNGVWGLCVYDSALYAGGDFTKSGSTTLNNIAMWNGPLGVNTVNKLSYSVNVFPNPSNSIFNFQSSDINKELNIEVYNTLGQQVYSSLITHSSSLISVASHRVFTSIALPIMQEIWYRAGSWSSNSPIATGKLIAE